MTRNRPLTRRPKPTGGWALLAHETQLQREGLQLGLGLGEERCIGLAIRKGQEEGRFAKQSDGSSNGTTSPKQFTGESSERMQTYAMTDGVSPEQFEKALTKAKAEKNLSRANVVRKVKGENDLEPSDSRRTSWN